VAGKRPSHSQPSPNPLERTEYRFHFRTMVALHFDHPIASHSTRAATASQQVQQRLGVAPYVADHRHLLALRATFHPDGPMSLPRPFHKERRAARAVIGNCLRLGRRTLSPTRKIRGQGLVRQRPPFRRRPAARPVLCHALTVSRTVSPTTPPCPHSTRIRRVMRIFAVAKVVSPGRRGCGCASAYRFSGPAARRHPAATYRHCA